MSDESGTAVVEAPESGIEVKDNEFVRQPDPPAAPDHDLRDEFKQYMGAETKDDSGEGDEPAPKDTKAEPKPEKKEEPQDWLDDDLVKAGREFSMTREEMREYGSPEALRRAIELANRAKPKGDPADNGSPEPKPDPKQEVKQEKPAEPPAFEPDLKLDLPVASDTADGFEPPLVEAFNKVNVHYAKQVAAMRHENERMRSDMGTLINQIKGAFGAIAERLNAHELNQFVEATQEDFGDFLGKGPTAYLATDAAEAKARKEVLDEAAIMERVLVAKGEPVPPLQELLKRAARSVFAVPLAQRKSDKAREAALKQRRDSRGQFTAEPSGREHTVVPSNETGKREFARMLNGR